MNPKTIIRDYLRHVRLFSINARYFLGGSFFMGFYMAVYWTMLNLYFKKLGLPEGTIGMINSCGALGTTLIVIPAAIFIDYIPIKRVMMAAAFITGAADICLVLMTKVSLICFFAALAGAMASVHYVAISPFFMRNSTPVERTHLYGVHHAVETSAGLSGALIGGYIPRLLADRGIPIVTGFRVAFIMAAVMAFVAVFIYRRIKDAPPLRHGRIRPVEYLGIGHKGIITRLCLPNTLVGLGAGLTIPFLNLYFFSRFGLDSAAIGKIYSGGQLFTIIGFLAGPALAKKAGIIKTVSLSQIASIPFFLVLAFGYDLAPVIVAFWFRNSLMNMSGPLYNNFAMEIVRPEYQAGTNSLMALSWHMAWMVSTFFGGKIIQHHGFVPVMLMTICLYFTGSLMVLLFFRARMSVGKAQAALIPPTA